MPYSSIAAGRDAILKQFTTAWNAQTPPIPVVRYDDLPGDLPPGNAPWARVNVRHTTAPQVTLGGVGGRRFRNYGILTVQVFSVDGAKGGTGGGLTQADALAKIVIDAFQGKSTKPDGVEFRNVRANEIGSSGSWFQTNVIADFEYDIIK